MRWIVFSIWILLCGYILQAQEEFLEQLESVQEEIAKKCKSVIVSIRAKPEPSFIEKTEPDIEFLPFIAGIFAPRPDAPTTGVIIDKDGYILTTFFNIFYARVKEIKVTLQDGKYYYADVVGYDARYDLALLKIKQKDLPVLPVASEPPETGSFIYALGMSPDGSGVTINQGIISATGRYSGKFTQMDCRLNYANVGGAIVSPDGKLVGITCRVSVRTASTIGQNSGIGFAVTVPTLATIIKELKDGKKIKSSSRPIIGITCDDIKGQGVLITTVHPGTPAWRAGIKPGSIIVEFDKKKVTDWQQLKRFIREKKPGDTVEIKIMRKGESKTFKIVLAEAEEIP